MKRFTVGDIKKWHSCYSPHKFIPIGWEGTALDILEIESCPARDRLWVVQRPQCIDAVTLRTHALWAVRYTFEHFPMNQDADTSLLSQVIAAIEKMNRDGFNSVENKNALVRDCFMWATMSRTSKKSAWTAAQYALGGDSETSIFRHAYHTTREASKAIGHDITIPVSRNEFYDIAADALIEILKEV